MSLFVADISANNANYNSFIKNNDAVIIKISEGLTYINPLANAQYQAVKQAGKKIGFYHFIVGGLDSRRQAEYFYNNAKNYLNEPGAILVLDWEKGPGYPNLTGNEPKAFLDRLYELTGKRGLLYMSTSDFLSANYNWSDIKNDYGLWIAGYPYNNGAAYTQDLQNWANNSQLYFANKKYDGYTVAMWQYDSVPYDRSVFYGDGNAWVKYGSKVGSSTSSSAKTTQTTTVAGAKFKVGDTVTLINNAWASSYGTKYTDKVKKQIGVIKSVKRYDKSSSHYSYEVKFDDVWNVLEQDITSHAKVELKQGTKVMLRSVASASAYGTKFNDKVKNSTGVIAYSVPFKKSYSNNLLVVAFQYDNQIIIWNVLEQDVIGIK